MYPAKLPMYKRACAPDWCLGIGDYEMDHFIGTNPTTRFSSCPPAGQDGQTPSCHHFGNVDIVAALKKDLDRPTRVQLEFCQMLRTSIDWERWVLREDL